MNLLRLDVQRFGKLENFALEPGRGLNTYCRPNEFGKTTLIYFIYYMFYGYQAKMLKKYLPWSGAEMAGSLTFEEGGRTWRIERRHPVKGMEKRRVFCLTTGEELTFANQEQPGPYFLGLDGETFLRTFCITQGDLLFSRTDGLDVALKNMAATGNENVSFQLAEDWLHKEHTRYMYRGKTQGPLLDKKQQMAEDTAELQQLMQKLDEQVEHRREWEELEKSIPESEKRLNALRLRLKKAEGSDALRLLQQLDAIREKKPLDPPPVSKERLDELEQAFAAKTQTAEVLAQAEQEKNRAAEQLQLMGETAGQFGFHALSGQEIERLQRKGGFPWWIALLATAIAADAAALLSNLGFLHGVAAGFLVAAITLVAVKKLRHRRICHVYGAANQQQLREKWEKYQKVLAQQEELRAVFKTAGEQVVASKADAAAAAERLEQLRSITRVFSPEELQQLRIQWGVYENSLKREQTALQEQAILGGRTREELEHLAEGAELLEETAAQVRMLLDRAETENRTMRSRREELDPRLLETFWEQRTSLQERIIANKREILQGEEQLAAVQTALGWLKEANEEMNTRFAPKLCALAGAHLARLTGGRYQSLLLDSKFSISLETSEGTHSLDQFSAGTRDAVYFAFRLAVSGMLSDAVLPMVLDDPFTNLDVARRSEAEALLKTAAAERQILYFTCHQ